MNNDRLESGSPFLTIICQSYFLIFDNCQDVMTTLDVAGNRISTLDGLDGLTKIEELWVSMMIVRKIGRASCRERV